MLGHFNELFVDARKEELIVFLVTIQSVDFVELFGRF
jgi:hypothetical protein